LIVIATAAAGYQAGVTSRRRPIVAISYALALTAVIVVIAAADDPGVGPTGPRYQPMIDLQASLNAS